MEAGLLHTEVGGSGSIWKYMETFMEVDEATE